MHINTQISQK